ncbi:hypothetical protein V1294_006318 [Bradyrhizobium sp. AZCC 1678]|uniref:hypothetical protein n=1 Tax=Bradyrhizobium sp. AZCC 1678 TaxID=3117030 RepID=UPI002FF12E43
MPALAEIPSNSQSEHDVTVYVREVLASALSSNYQVHQGANLLYRIEIDGSGKISNNGDGAPRRGQYAFQTDILVSKAEIPLVVTELKSGTFSTHDVITYSWKAQRHKQVYPYLRYGFAVVGLETLGRRFITHNEGFDFAVAVPNRAEIEADLVPIVRRQIISAERIIELTRQSRIKLRRFEQNIEIDA